MRIPAPTSRLRFGIGTADITPPVGIYHRMWGAARHDRAAGVHRSLRADLLLLAPLERGPLLVRAHLDLVGLAAPQHEELRQALAQTTAAALDRVILTYSHTHSSGFFVPNRIELAGGELIPGYLGQLRLKLQEAATQALYAMQEATVTYATGQCDMAANRDCWDEEAGHPVCGFNPEGEADQSVVVARFTSRSGQLLASLVNYSCHPTTLAWDNQLISPDYPGALREVVEKATNAPCTFALGACGDQGPRDGFVGDPAVADRNGRQVGYAALATLESMGPPLADFHYQGPVVSGATLGAWAHTSFSPERLEQTTAFAGGLFHVDLPLKPGLEPGRFQGELEEWTTRQKQAEAKGEALEARNCRALAERALRWLARLEGLPKGPTYPFQFTVHRLGDAIWATSGGEPYSLVQTELRRRFPHYPLLFSPLTSDFQVAYLLPRDRYGKGLYQEEPSSLAPGCLELLIEALASRIAAL
ncbi:MAG: hypothetical protein FJY95_00710 [Candidatus Handelsmanbacteria bacterium]|nr:hypothetical protein [Candidatus Handelsmanbacteria bacterium]